LLFQQPSSNETLCEAYLESVPAPIGGLLFFVWAKKSNQKKAHPDAALILRAVVFVGGCQKGLPAPLATGATLRADPDENASARRGKREKIKTTPTAIFSLRGLS
jgi:hypothetical protein